MLVRAGEPAHTVIKTGMNYSVMTMLYSLLTSIILSGIINFSLKQTTQVSMIYASKGKHCVYFNFDCKALEACIKDTSADFAWDCTLLL